MKKYLLIICLTLTGIMLHAEDKRSFFDDFELTMTGDVIIYNDSVGYGGTVGVMTDLGGSTFMKNVMIGLGARYRGAISPAEDLMINSVGGYGMIGYQFYIPFGLRIMPGAKAGALYQMRELGDIVTSDADLTVFPSVQIDYLFKNFRLGLEGGYSMVFSENLITNIQISLFASYSFRNTRK